MQAGQDAHPESVNEVHADDGAIATPEVALVHHVTPRANLSQHSLPTVGQNSHELGRKYWATRSSARSHRSFPRSWESELLISQNDLNLAHSAAFDACHAFAEQTPFSACSKCHPWRPDWLRSLHHPRCHRPRDPRSRRKRQSSNDLRIRKGNSQSHSHVPVFAIFAISEFRRGAFPVSQDAVGSSASLQRRPRGVRFLYAPTSADYVHTCRHEWIFAGTKHEWTVAGTGREAQYMKKNGENSTVKLLNLFLPSFCLFRRNYVSL